MNRRYRKTDLDTSVKAAKKVKEVAREKRRILALFNDGDFTDSELEAKAIEEDWPMAGKTYYRRRRSELKNEGYLLPSTDRRRNKAGNPEIVWTLKRRHLGGKMSNQNENFFDDEQVTFTRADDGSWVLKGRELAEGESVVVSRADGSTTTVIVGKILGEDSWGNTLYAWENIEKEIDIDEDTIIFVKDDDGDYLIRGKDLLEGEIVTVTRADGSCSQVIVEQILDEIDGIQYACFANVERDINSEIEAGKIVFLKHDGEVMIAGAGLEPKSIVEATTKIGKKIKVQVGGVVSDQDGIQIAQFANVKTRSKESQEEE
ncbi:MAG: hypothetical protein SPG61_05940 [Arcanobacterium sp.]|nr:hypothetical protein [Arcanobacterium sp.]